MGLHRHSKLFRKAFLALVLGLLLWFPIFYLLTVPALERMAYESEEAASRNVLNGVLEVVKRASADLDAWRRSSLERHREQLRSVLSIVDSYAGQLEREIAAGQLTRPAARAKLLAWLRSLRYGDDGYLWASDYRSVLLAHPEARYDGKDVSQVRDVNGQLVIPPMIETARRAGEGFANYWWPRLQGGRAEEKLSYFRDLPAWGLVVGTGLYLDDIEAEMARRKVELIADLRSYLHGIRLAGSGYVFVIDGNEDVVVHPDPAVEGRSMRDFHDGGDGEPLAPLLVRAAQSADHRASYRWNHPDDPANFSYQKIAWVYPVPQFDWYLGASVYVDDLTRPGGYLRHRLIAGFLAGLGITSFGAYLFLRRLTAPIHALADVARRQAAGESDALAAVASGDELGDLAEAFNRMVLARQAQTAELRASEGRLRALFEQSLAGIFVIQDGRFAYVNAAFARMHGYDSAAEIVGQLPVADLLAPEQRDELLAALGRLQAGSESGGERVFTALARDGRRFEVCCSLAAVDYAGGRGLIGIALDVTEARRAERARGEALAAAEQLSRLKSQFIANMSHELLTPLNGIIGMAAIGERCRELDKAHDYFGHVREAGEGLLEMVGNVLDYSRLSDHKLALADAPFDLAELLTAQAELWRERAAARGLRFAMRLAPGLPTLWCGDRLRFEQLLGCLLGNAVKFTEQGEIRLLAAVADRQLEIAVADSGIGIAAERLAELFHPFEQLDGAADRHYGGLGLGLALARQLASLMGGEIAVAAEPGGGTRFTVVLPLPTVAAIQPMSADISG